MRSIILPCGIFIYLEYIGEVGGNFYMKQKKRVELIAGCVVPKENVLIFNTSDIEVLSDAKIVTTNISQRNETSMDANHKDWCLDTTVTVGVKFLKNIKEIILEDKKKIFPKYYSSPDFNGKVWFRTAGWGESSENCISCSYQSKSATRHGFDNVHQVSETILNLEEENKTGTLTLRLTQIGGSKKECEDLAIKLHKSGKFSFQIGASYDQYKFNWEQKHK